jgi:hypothetical protein
MSPKNTLIVFRALISRPTPTLEHFPTDKRATIPIGSPSRLEGDTIAHCTYALEGNHKCIFYTKPLCGHLSYKLFTPDSYGMALMEAVEPSYLLVCVTMAS